MIRPKSIQNVLLEISDGGILSTLLLRLDGTLVATAVTPLRGNENIVCAMASSMWNSLHKTDQNSPDESLIVQCEKGYLIIENIGATFLLCIQANRKYPLGLLKFKCMKLAQFLRDKLHDIL